MEVLSARQITTIQRAQTALDKVPGERTAMDIVAIKGLNRLRRQITPEVVRYFQEVRSDLLIHLDHPNLL